MVLDIGTGVFVLLLSGMGFWRGLLSQLVSLGGALALWITMPLWFPRVGAFLASADPTLAGHPWLARAVGFVGAYVALLIAAAVLEYVFIKRIGPLKWSNHWGGAALGGAKGALYAAVVLWALQGWSLWRKAPEDPTPAWLQQSQVVAAIGPYNPLRLYSVRELVEIALQQAEDLQRRASSARGMAQDASEGRSGAATSSLQTPRGGAGGEGSSAGAAQGSSAQAPGSLVDSLRDAPAKLDATTRLRLAKLKESPAFERLTQSLEGEDVGAMGYLKLLGEPEVRALLADPAVRDLLFGS